MVTTQASLRLRCLIDLNRGNLFVAGDANVYVYILLIRYISNYVILHYIIYIHIYKLYIYINSNKNMNILVMKTVVELKIYPGRFFLCDVKEFESKFGKYFS